MISAVLLIPCFWHKRIEAGDLSSHLYNAWLATEIEAGRGAGLALAHPLTNVLTDQVLTWLTKTSGPAVAEHVTVPLLVLILFWGGVAWIKAATGAAPWSLYVCLAMVAYGWVFHMGFLNFYLSTGIAFWILALLWRPTPPRLLGALPLLAVGLMAHPISMLWAMAVLAYVWAARRVPERFFYCPPLVALAAVGIFRVYLDAHYRTLSTSHQILEMWGVDQVWVFGLKYIATAVLLGVLWAFHLLRLLYSRPLRGLVRNIPFQLGVVMSIAVLVTPTRVELPEYEAALAFVTERMTLPFSVLICLLLNQVPPVRWQSLALGGVAALQFSFLYVDTGALNWWESQVAAAVAPLPPGARVVASLHDWESRVVLWPHALDRICIGHCASYQNYEAASRQFRVRATKPNGLVMHDARDTAAAEAGAYVVQTRDLPLFFVTPCADGRLCAAPMAAGSRLNAVSLSLLPTLW